MSRDYPPLKRKKQKIKDAREWVVAKYSYIPAIVIFAVAVFSLAFWNDGGSIVAPIFAAAGIPLLVAAMNCRITMNTEQITVRNFFRVSKTYLFSEIESWRENTHYVYLYPVNGRRICVRNDDEVDGGMGDLFLQLKKRSIRKREGESDSKLYWGNCSRPVQLTLFLSLMSFLFLGSATGFCGGILNLSTKEEDLERKSFVVVDVLVDEAYVYLYESTENFYDIDQPNLPTYDWNTLKGTRITVLTDDITGVWALYDRYGNKVFDFEDSYNANKNEAIGMTAMCGIFALIPLAFFVMTFLAYKDPDKYSGLWVWMETVNFWRRHGS